jgi:hypothetical protein
MAIGVVAGEPTAPLHPLRAAEPAIRREAAPDPATPVARVAPPPRTDARERARPPSVGGPPSAITVSIGRIDVEVAAPPAPVATRPGPERTRGFDAYAGARRGRPR